MFRSPLTKPARITSSFASHLSDSRRNFAGIDLVYASGESYRQPIVAVSNQRIIQVQNNFVDPNEPLRYGEKYIYAQDLANPRVTFLYLHNDENLVKVGQTVNEGDQIALMGYSGWTIPDNVPQGTHLHFEVRIDGQRVDPALHTDFNKLGTTQPVIQPDVTVLTAQAGDGISHLLKRAGRTDFASEQAWLETSRLNGVHNGLMRVLVGQAYKVPLIAQKPQIIDIVKPEPQPPVEVTPPVMVETPTPEVVTPQETVSFTETDDGEQKETKTADSLQVTKDVNQSGRILGVSKKLTSAITAGITYLGILNSLPPEVLSQEVGGLPVSIWSGAVLALLNGAYIAVQGIIDYKDKQ